MPCDFPIKAYRTEEISPSGKRLLTFNPLKALNSTNPIDLPCGRCTGCRLERSRQWAIRMHHEAKLHDRNCFITLTYNNESVPTDYSLDLRHWQLFMKRLRKSLPQKLRFYACGEYGDENLRPHYHAIIFNHDFNDKKIHSYNHQKDPIYISDTLTNLWEKGHCTTQDVTYKTMAYVSRYVQKKQFGSDDRALNHYTRISPMDGKAYTVRPEFAVMSRRPGIGTGYVEQFKNDYYPSGYIVVDGRKVPPPQFYINKLSEEEQAHLKWENWKRVLPSKRKAEKTNERLQVRAEVRDARIRSLKRKL